MQIASIFKIAGSACIFAGIYFLITAIQGLSFSWIFSAGFFFGSAIWFIVGLFFVLTPLIETANNAKLLQNGTKISTKFFNVELNQMIKVNGKSPYQIISALKDPKTGETKLFKSENVWFNPERFVKKTIYVYVDPKNSDNYVMDISFIKENVDKKLSE